MKAIEGFRINISRAKMLGGLFKAVSSLTTSALDTSDLLRSQIIMSVSAMDFYVHELVRECAVEMYEGNRPIVDGFKQFQVSLIDAKTFISSGTSEWVSDALRVKHSYLSFQHPDKVAEAIRLINPQPIWPQLEQRLGVPAKTLKENLRLIVDRRNKIAHEADMDPSYPGARWPILLTDANQASEFIEKLCEAIQLEVA